MRIGVGVLETHTDQDPLALDVDVGNGELVGERHDELYVLTQMFTSRVC